MKKNLSRLVTLCVAVAFFAGCTSKLEEIKMTSCSVVSVSPKSLRSAELVLDVGVDNPAFTLIISDFKGVLKSGAKVAGTFSTDSFTLEGKTNQKYTVPVQIELDKSFSMKDALSIFSRKGVDGFTMDMSAKVRTKNGKDREVSLNGIYLSKFIY